VKLIVVRMVDAQAVRANRPPILRPAPPVCSTVPIQIDAWARRRCLVLPTGLTCYGHIRDVFSRCSLNWVGRARLWGTNGGIRKTLA